MVQTAMRAWPAPPAKSARRKAARAAA